MYEYNPVDKQGIGLMYATADFICIGFVQH